MILNPEHADLVVKSACNTPEVHYLRERMGACPELRTEDPIRLATAVNDKPRPRLGNETDQVWVPEDETRGLRIKTAFHRCIRPSDWPMESLHPCTIL